MTQPNQDQIQKIVDLAAPVSRVWRALTDHEEFGRWFRVRLDGPFEIGATTTGRMTYPGHEDVEWVSTTERLEPERVFAFSWPPSAVDPDTEYDADAKVLVEFRLEPTDDIGRIAKKYLAWDRMTVAAVGAASAQARREAKKVLSVR